MLKVKKEGVIIKNTTIAFEDESVLNPAVVQNENVIHLFYRAVQTGNYSSIGYCKLNGPLKVVERMDKPLLVASFDYESHGLEDPRIVRIDGLYYLTYVAFDGRNALGALATSTDLVNFDKKGTIVPKIKYEDFERITRGKNVLNEKYLRYNRGADVLADKDLVFFPRRINGKLTFLHRIKPDIQLVSIDHIEDLTEEFWADYFFHFEEKIALTAKYAHEVSYIGSGCPPIETAHGWLLIYHGVKDVIKGYEYCCCAALMDLNDPCKELARLPYPLFKPEEDYELKGDVDDVCFPTGTSLFHDTLYIYYGAADELVACASLSLSGLTEELLANKVD